MISGNACSTLVGDLRERTHSETGFDLAWRNQYSILLFANKKYILKIMEYYVFNKL